MDKNENVKECHEIDAEARIKGRRSGDKSFT
jgi:hypothetical protein